MLDGFEECGRQIRDSVLYDIAVGLCGANSVLPIIYKQRSTKCQQKSRIRKRMCFNRGDKKGRGKRGYGLNGGILGEISFAVRDIIHSTMLQKMWHYKVKIVRR